MSSDSKTFEGQLLQIEAKLDELSKDVWYDLSNEFHIRTTLNQTDTKLSAFIKQFPHMSFSVLKYKISQQMLWLDLRLIIKQYETFYITNPVLDSALGIFHFFHPQQVFTDPTAMIEWEQRKSQYITNETYLKFSIIYYIRGERIDELNQFMLSGIVPPVLYTKPGIQAEFHSLVSYYEDRQLFEQRMLDISLWKYFVELQGEVVIEPVRCSIFWDEFEVFQELYNIICASPDKSWIDVIEDDEQENIWRILQEALQNHNPGFIETLCQNSKIVQELIRSCVNYDVTVLFNQIRLNEVVCYAFDIQNVHQMTTKVLQTQIALMFGVIRGFILVETKELLLLPVSNDLQQCTSLSCDTIAIVLVYLYGIDDPEHIDKIETLLHRVVVPTNSKRKGIEDSDSESQMKFLKISK